MGEGRNIGSRDMRGGGGRGSGVKWDLRASK